MASAVSRITTAPTPLGRIPLCCRQNEKTGGRAVYDFGGKVALVTGAAGQHGVGRAIALRLAREGANVAVTDLRDAPAGNWGGLGKVVDEIGESGRGALGCVGDVTIAADADRMVEETLDRFGRIDILVNNAGSPAGPDRVPVVELDEAVWDRVIDVNAKGTFLMCRAVARHMIASEANLTFDPRLGLRSHSNVKFKSFTSIK
jgi:NAD(P)-dependent dehydrogenase (short-subunit alcohol dehydrogenase family)